MAEVEAEELEGGVGEKLCQLARTRETKVVPRQEHALHPRVRLHVP